MSEPAERVNPAPVIEPEVVGKRGVVSATALILLQLQNAFNDNLARFVLVALSAWLVKEKMISFDVKHILALSLLVPFIALSPFAGWMADRFRKNRVIRHMAWLQVVALMFMAFALWRQSLVLACIAFFILATQSALLSPAKMGIVKELVGSRRLTLVSGIMEATVILAILAGQILAGVWFADRVKVSGDGWQAALWPVIVLLAFCAIALVNAYSIQRTPLHAAPSLSRSVVFSHRRELAFLLGPQDRRWVAFGVAYFWGFAGAINMLVLQIAYNLTGGGEEYGRQMAQLLTGASGGIAAGSLLAGLMGRKRMELGVVAIGAILMTVGTVALAFQAPPTIAFYISLVVASAGAAMMVVPLTAYLQENSSPEKRGSVMASSNILNNVFGAVGVVLQMMMERSGASVEAQIWVFAAVAGVVMVITLRFLLIDLLRFLLRCILTVLFKIRVTGAENMPAEGGALIVANHVGYLDALVLSASVERRVRFLIAEDMVEKWWARPAVTLFGAVPIDARSPRKAIKVAAQTLQAGDVVGIFPEGKLTRTGELGEIRSGYQLIAKQGNAPIIPIKVTGLWGAFLSRSKAGEAVKWTPWPLRKIIHVDIGSGGNSANVSPEIIKNFLTY